MARLPVDVRDLLKAGKRLDQDRGLPVGIAVFIELDAPDALIDELRAQLRPRTSGATLQVEVVEQGKALDLKAGMDAAVLVAGTGTGLIDTITMLRKTNTPVAVLGMGEEEYGDRLADLLLQPLGDLVVRPTAAQSVEELGAWLAETLASKRLALAHNFPFMRRAVADEAVKTTAWQNGLVGAVAIFPGADMPIMTANQAKMLLQIAAAYGEKLGADRIKELAVIVGGGFTLRAVARQMLTAVPVMGWAVKGGIGYAGTMAMGKAAVAYFDEGADMMQVASKLKERAVEHLPGHQGPGELPGAVEVQPEPGVVVVETENSLE